MNKHLHVFDSGVESAGNIFGYASDLVWYNECAVPAGHKSTSEHLAA
jgi:hypothetical protein